MRTTKNLKLNLPALGTNNWGGSINDNFDKLDENFGNIKKSITNIETTMNVGVPYWQLYKDINGNEYEFVTINVDEENRLTSLTYTNKPIDPTSSINIPAYDFSLISGCGAYVIGINKTEGQVPEKNNVIFNSMTQTWEKGAILVVVYTTSGYQLRKYPDSGYYIKPTISVNGDKVQINYEKKTYPDWVENELTSDATPIPAFHFVERSINNSNSCKLEFVVAADTTASKLGVFAKFYTKSGNSKSSFLIDYTTNVSIVGTIATITISWTDGLPDNAYCSIYAGQTRTGNVTSEEVLNA